MNGKLTSSISLILTASALGLVLQPGITYAQTPGLEEIVVTATRREDTIQNIPLSITAVTPEQVERQGLKSAQDIARVVPALRIGSSNNANGQADVAIRGIRSTTGAATTGIYIDDVSLTQRNINNPLPGGSVLPQLFDLDRVEVLRGPQGTLYGGSSEGGTVRFITPQPSLTEFSSRARVEGSHTEDGEYGYDFGAVVGAPLIDNVLGFRFSGAYRKDAGYVDHVSRFSGNTIAEDTNESVNKSARLSLAWEPAEAATVTLSYLYSSTENDDSDAYWENIPAHTGLAGGAPRNYAALNMYGPYNSGRNTNVGDNFYTSDAQLSALLNANTHEMNLPSLTVDYAFGKVDFKSITAYVQTKNTAGLQFAYAEPEARTPALAPLANSPFVANLPVYNSLFAQSADNDTFSEELRFSSNDPDARLSWVAGLYYSDTKLSTTATITANFGELINAVVGAPATPPTFNGQVATFPQKVREKQSAAFGELTYAFTEQFKGTAGVRFTRNELDIEAFQGGALFFPTSPGTIITTVDTSQTEEPVTPKIGLQYLTDANTNFYFNASKGFRPGGANTDLRSGNCAPAVQRIFGSNYPLVYDSDSLWSYEAGAKVRPDNGRVSINASVFYVDWKNVQTSVTLDCGQPVTVTNVDIISQGADLETSFQLFDGFLATFNVGYTDSTVNGRVVADPLAPAIFQNGDRVPFTPEWTGSVGGQYEFLVIDRESFVRVDYQYQGSMVLTAGPGTSNYAIDNYTLPSTSFVSARAGMKFDSFDVSIFVNNLLNSDDVLNRAGLSPTGPGRIQCITDACAAPVRILPGAEVTSFRPRTIGVALDYRF